MREKHIKQLLTCTDSPVVEALKFINKVTVEQVFLTFLLFKKAREERGFLFEGGACLRGVLV